MKKSFKIKLSKELSEVFEGNSNKDISSIIEEALTVYFIIVERQENGDHICMVNEEGVSGCIDVIDQNQPLYQIFNEDNEDDEDDEAETLINSTVDIAIN